MTGAALLAHSLCLLTCACHTACSVQQVGAVLLCWGEMGERFLEVRVYLLHIVVHVRMRMLHFCLPLVLP